MQNAKRGVPISSRNLNMSRIQTATNRTPRLINRNLIFNLIRNRSISRADLARVSGLQPSTVSLIVKELIQEEWVVEGTIARSVRGRRPTFLELNSRRAIIGLDIHPNQTAIAVADFGGKILAQQTIPLPQDPAKGLNAIISAVNKLMASNKGLSYAGIGICLPGRTDIRHKKLIFAPHLGWPVLALKAKIERATGLRVSMDNVANACALSEAWFGSNNRIHDLVVVNVSEGISTGVFTNGELLRGLNGMAGEFGHVQVDPSGLLCACGSHGCWETFASNSAGIRFYNEAVAPPKPPSFEELVRLSQHGDEAAIQALRRMAENLGRGLRMITTVLDPEEIVVVGSITAVWHIYGAIVQAELKKHALATPPIVRPAYDGNSTRLLSAVALVVWDNPAGTE
jgi:predicted NBD/HSP70 family sugar kinase